MSICLSALDRVRSRRVRATSDVDEPIAAWQTGRMGVPWAEIREHFRRMRQGGSCGHSEEALAALEQLAQHIAAGPLATVLFGWTSMQDLCIQQSDVAPFSGPFLRVHPLARGMVEFRYEDTAVRGRQWHREVPPAAAIARLEAFLDQLGWVHRMSD